MKDGGTTARTDNLIATYSSKGPTLFDHYAEPISRLPAINYFHHAVDPYFIAGLAAKPGGFGYADPELPARRLRPAAWRWIRVGEALSPAAKYDAATHNVVLQGHWR